VKIGSVSHRIELHFWNASAGLPLTADVPRRDVAVSRMEREITGKTAPAALVAIASLAGR
jgi:hypothetical protein